LLSVNDTFFNSIIILVEEARVARGIIFFKFAYTIHGEPGVSLKIKFSQFYHIYIENI